MQKKFKKILSYQKKAVILHRKLKDMKKSKNLFNILLIRFNSQK